jgi:hypothetical protein
LREVNIVCIGAMAPSRLPRVMQQHRLSAARQPKPLAGSLRGSGAVRAAAVAQSTVRFSVTCVLNVIPLLLRRKSECKHAVDACCVYASSCTYVPSCTPALIRESIWPSRHSFEALIRYMRVESACIAVPSLFFTPALTYLAHLSLTRRDPFSVTWIELV